MVFASSVRGFFGRGGVLFVKKVGIYEIKSVSMGYRDPWVSGRGWEMTLTIYHPPLFLGTLFPRSLYFSGPGGGLNIDKFKAVFNVKIKYS